MREAFLLVAGEKSFDKEIKQSLRSAILCVCLSLRSRQKNKVNNS